MLVTINDIGDGNYIRICDYWKRFGCIIDYGSINCSRYFKKNMLPFPDSIDFDLLISHYHTDHYNGLCYIPDDSISVNKLFYPWIPKFSQKTQLIKQILFTNYIILGSQTGSPAKDLVDLLSIKNQTSFHHQALKQGDEITICGQTFYVVWPPYEIQDNDNNLAKGIEEIDKLIKENDELNELWENLDRNSNELFCNADLRPKDKTCKTVDNKYELKCNKSSIENLSKKLRSITNRFSICLYHPEEFLFLGDLEEYEINHCIEYLKKSFRLNHVETLITPHHGTHWGEKLIDIYAKNIISSNGEQRIQKYVEDYKLIGENIYSTFQNGTLNFFMTELV